MGKPMKILLVSSYNGIYPKTVFPIGLAYLASSLRAAGHQADILDLSFYNNDTQVLAETLAGYSPDLIGLSIRDVDSSGRDIFHHKPGAHYLSDYKPFINTWKKFNYPGVLGGAGFSLFPGEILKYYNLKLGIIGEGEHTFIELVSRIQENKAIHNLPGLAYYENNHFRFNPPKCIGNLDKLHFPLRKILGNHGNVIGNIQTKRGCNQSCIYCSYPVVEGRRIRLRSPALVVDEFEIMVKSLGYKYIFIVDSIFNNPSDHAYEICKELIRRKIKVQWGCNANPGLMSEKLLKIMKKAGCYDIILGTDSLSDKILKNLGKNYDVDSIKKTNKWAKNNELVFIHSLILGGPGENQDTIEETLSNIDKLDPALGIGISHGLRIYPQTRLEQIAIEEGCLPPRYNLLKPRYYVSSPIKRKLRHYAEKFIPFITRRINKPLLVDELEKDYPPLDTTRPPLTS